MRATENRERGFVSLFTCIIISLLLLIITISLISLESLQLRKSEDAEQTLRAYYVAEAGIEDAVSKVLSGTISPGVGDNTCDPLGVSGASYAGSAGWTCQQVTFTGEPFGKLDAPDLAKTVDPGTAIFDSVLVEWDQSTNPLAAFYNPVVAGGLPTQAAWGAHAAPLELAIVQYPKGGFAAGDPGLKLENALLVPSTAAPATINYSGAGFTNHGPWSGNCAPRVATGAGGFNGKIGYNCYALINGFNGPYDYLFRVRSRYASSAYRLSFYSSNVGSPGSEVSVPDGTATIDVTAKAGQTYRRVISKLPLNDSAAAGLNYVMYSDTDICKNFEVIDNVVPAGSGCSYP